MGISFEDIKENGIINTVSLNMLSCTCREGNRLEFNIPLNKLECNNKDCKCHIFNRLDTIGMKDIEDIVYRYNIISPYQLFTITPYNRMCNKELYLHEVISLCGIEEISPIAYKLAYGYNSIDEFYTELSIDYINLRLGIDNEDMSPISYFIYNTLLELRDELIFAESLFKIKSYNNRLRMAFNDSYDKFLNLWEFIENISNRFNRYTFIPIVTIDDNTDILIKNSGLESERSRLARIVNDKYTARLLNSDKYTLEDIGKFTGESIKPIGSLIYIDNINNLIKRLEVLSDE